MEKDSEQHRLPRLRRWMAREGLDALIVFTSDPHNSEYTPDRWKLREWLTGFTGSAGTAVVTADDALLWTDSRYYIQAGMQLADGPFRLMKDGAPGVPDIAGWLSRSLEPGSRVGFVGKQTSWENIHALKQATPELQWVGKADPFNDLWLERPRRSAAPVRIHPLEYAGRSARQKIDAVLRTVQQETGANSFLMNDLSEIAWVLNLRGSDVAYNPVFTAYLLLERRGALLFIDRQKMTKDIVRYLAAEQVSVIAYDHLDRALRLFGRSGIRLAVPPGMNYGVIDNLRAHRIPFEICTASPAEKLRAVKTGEEMAGMRRSMERDGVALVKFLRWMEQAVAAGGQTEYTAGHELTRLRSLQPLFEEPSFTTIAGYGPNGAIVHYEAAPDTAAPLRPEGLLLLDSGGQYADGTTDITRTLALGPVSADERRAYTLVLKGHIALSRCRFPAGTTGLQLDTTARYAMWQEGYDFGHGTGHGVGAHLCVHEGPHQIRKNVRACALTPLQPGMVVTDEPGIYAEGRFGVRIENTLAVRRDGSTPYGDFLAFEPLTLCPIDTRPIDRGMLTPEETAWLDDYHRTVRERLMPLLDDEADRRWLERATQPLG